MDNEWIQSRGLFEVVYRFCYVFPCGILCENRSHTNFKGGISRPPVAMAELGVQSSIIIHEQFSETDSFFRDSLHFIFENGVENADEQTIPSIP